MLGIDFSKIAAGIVKPQIVFAMLCRVLTDACLFRVTMFEMWFLADPRDVFFYVYLPEDRKGIPEGIISQYDNEGKKIVRIAEGMKMINKAIDTYVKGKMQKGETLDMAVLRYYEDGKYIVLDMGFRDAENNKQKLTHKL